MRLHRFSRSDGAVSVVVGAILVAAILFALVVMFRVSYLPTWETRAEASHMDLVERELTNLRVDLDRQVEGGIQAPLNHPLTLAQGGFNPLLPDGTQHQVMFLPRVAWVNLSSSELLLSERDGRSLVGVHESWLPVSGNLSLENVASLDHLRVRLAGLSSGDDGDSLAITVLHPGGAYAGDVTVSVRANPPGYDLYVVTRNATGGVLVDQTFASSLQGTGDRWVDALSDDLRLSPLLEAVEGPVTLRLESRGLDATYAVSYLREDGGARVRMGGSGVREAAWTSTHEGGALVYSARNARYVDQDLRVENGALMVTQSEGGSMNVPPIFEVARVGDVLHVELSVPTLKGESASVGGSSITTVRTQVTARSALAATAPDLTMRVQTGAPGLWSALWNETLAGVPGLVAGQHYVVASDATSATLTLSGLATDGRHDLDLMFRQADVRVEVDA